jgi:hypothetical protein
MSLVVAFIGKNGAVMAGDMREITFDGERVYREKLEKELYNGEIVSDEELEKKAGDLGVEITVRDDKNKILSVKFPQTRGVLSENGGCMFRQEIMRLPKSRVRKSG